MERKTPTWFGFTLTQKQAVTIFVLALLGVLICTFVFIMFSSMYMNYYYSTMDPYYYIDDDALMMISRIPILIFFIVIFIICCYSLSKCKQTAKYYNKMKNYPQPQTQHRTYIPRAPQRIIPETKPAFNERMFCPNCGTKHDDSHQFCINCGFELV